MTIDDIIENFALLDDWDDRYRYVIELGRGLVPLPEQARTDTNKVQGCASQVWLSTEAKPDGEAGPILTFKGDSDAHIVRGLIAILFALYSGRPARETAPSSRGGAGGDRRGQSTQRRMVVFPKVGGVGVKGVDSEGGEHRCPARPTPASSSSRPSA